MAGRFIRLILAGLLSAPLTDATWANDTPGRLKASYDHLTLPDREALGLLGTAFLVDTPGDTYLGMGIYSAIRGQRGGFFTGGLEAGWRPALPGAFRLDTGVFVGGGGGGGAPQGGGLMLRPHLGLVYPFRTFAAGAEYSQVRFPNGDIKSGQWSATIDLPFNTATQSGWDQTERPYAHRDRMRRRELNVVFSRYSPGADAATNTGKALEQDIDLVGMEYALYYTPNVYLSVAAAGAWGGNVDGYAQLFGGLGGRLPVGAGSQFYLEGGLGAGGGGNIDTGGGGLWRLRSGFDYRSDSGLLLGVGVGYVAATGSDFTAQSAHLRIGHSAHVLTVTSTGHSDESTGSAKPRHWAWTPQVVRYLPTSANRNKLGERDRREIDLIGLAVSTPVNDFVFIQGQALSAYRHAGGYAVGLLGLGAQFAAAGPLSAQTSLNVGAAGGGGIDSGSGFIVQPTLGARWRFAQAFSIDLDGGYVSAPAGGLRAYTLALGLRYAFSSYEAR